MKNKDFEGLRNDTRLEVLIEEEFLENSDGDFGKVFIAEGDQEVILHLRKYLNPLI